ncbi:G-patch domain-containing protein [Tribonema minus]|uniref:G-patch domain-containing protein n=1 Tax=Tribonema minus TaxID=303371 RepID=A0A835ZDF6_9STRA|nr:G-patch domain-containing protein [Tribonema minus]
MASSPPVSASGPASASAGPPAASATLNQAWANSRTDGIAYKLMRKMGWSEGKGLGKDEDGIASHIRVQRRDGNLGLGAAKDRDGSAGWSATTTSFSAVLATLNQAYQPPKKDKKKRKKEGKASGSSSETKAAAAGISSGDVCPSRARRVKAKDIRTFSSTDLKAILGHAPAVADAWSTLPSLTAGATAAHVIDDGSDCSAEVKGRKRRREGETKEERRARKAAKKAAAAV